MTETPDAVAAPVVRCAHSGLVDPRTLKPHPSNPNVHPPKQIEMFIAIIRFTGWRRPITVSTRSGFVTKGHGALEAALAAGFDQVPVDEQDYDSVDAELADLVADNQLQRMSEMNTGKLTELLVHLDSGKSVDLEMTGLETRKIEKILTAFDQRNPDQQNVTPGGAPAIVMGEREAPVTGGKVEPPPTQRSILLFLSEADADDFTRICAFFRETLDLASDVAAVMAILRSAFTSHTETETNEER